ncbi:hypothetical protein [Halosegnis marinus]|uniref:Lipoprotein n=1 Tax=Halosegnis marinus TaxID=3034023 RepID=A0ABD5ZMV8_9EURY|nr:hypothetical protein [Halosegnis sp. DT85]
MRALLVAALLVLAGCGTAGPAPTDTATAAPVPDSGSYPPGVDGDGVVSAVALGNAHAEATAGSYRVRSNWTVRHANGTLRGRVVQRATVTPAAWTTTLVVTGDTGIVADGNATAVFYSEGEALVQRVRRPNRTTYLYVPPAEYNGGSGFYNSLRRPKPYRDPGVLADAVALRLAERAPNGSVVLAGDSLADASLFELSVGVAEPRNVSYRLRVTASGLVRTQRLAYTGTVRGETVVVTRTVRYLPYDGTVERPPWYDTARNESVRG